MDKNEIKQQTLEIVGNVLPDVDVSNVDTQASLMEEYDVNSVSLIQLLVGLEDKFDVSFEDRELSLNKYANFDDIVDTVEKKINQ